MWPSCDRTWHCDIQMICIICHLSPVSEQRRGSPPKSGVVEHLRTEGMRSRNVVAWRAKSCVLLRDAWVKDHTEPWTRQRLNDQKMAFSEATCNMCCYFVKSACTAALWFEVANFEGKRWIFYTEEWPTKWEKIINGQIKKRGFQPQDCLFKNICQETTQPTLDGHVCKSNSHFGWTAHWLESYMASNGMFNLKLSSLVFD